MVEPITVRVGYNALGNVERVTYTWPEGCYRAHIRAVDLSCSWFELRPGDRLTIGPYQVRVIELDFLCRSVVVVRDGSLWWTWLLASQAGRRADLAYRRLITTAAVWGLADYDAGRVPNWRDLHVARWLLKQWGR
jgi:hypothetical protein